MTSGVHHIKSLKALAARMGVSLGALRLFLSCEERRQLEREASQGMYPERFQPSENMQPERSL